jgi:hypothetical protein
MTQQQQQQHQKASKRHSCEVIEINQKNRVEIAEVPVEF